MVIIGLGSGMGAVNETSRIIRPLLEFLFPDALPETLSVYHGYIRKFAHFAEYAVLGFLACRVFRSSRSFLFPLLVVFLVAIVDETKQTFDPTRTGSIYDVAIDVLGGLTAIALYAMVTRRKAK